ncbi:hypothetical protein VN12_03640 [Pirellula sp. SH-Sr6A]|uniref:hypothetical protein n=1 Tax=Pirellula sp. SH-Sr6A TaxID=1632865 RepID=UPI00078E48F1|nr:hypothetical protein [Pirellula sp. SH-Sr6A]AMV31185.1 hypothetical protein VN12_03640 [Pirellula sp. SH-Sr6A]
MRGKLWKRILLSPWVLLPAAVSVVSFWIGYPWLGLGASLVTAASFAGLLAFRFDALKRSMESEAEDEQARLLEQALDMLATRLRADRDYRTKDALSIARASRESFRKSRMQNELPIQSVELQKQFDSLFEALIEQLERSLELFEQADKLSGSARDTILQARESCVAEITTASIQLHKAAEHLGNIIRSRKEEDLAPLQEELEASLRIAKRVEERLREWDESISPSLRENQ